MTVLRIAPADFWRLSVAEWLWLTAGSPSAALGRAGLTDLMRLYPDKEHDARIQN